MLGHGTVDQNSKRMKPCLAGRFQARACCLWLGVYFSDCPIMRSKCRSAACFGCNGGHRPELVARWAGGDKAAQSWAMPGLAHAGPKPKQNLILRRGQLLFWWFLALWHYRKEARLAIHSHSELRSVLHAHAQPSPKSNCHSFLRLWV